MLPVRDPSKPQYWIEKRKRREKETTKSWNTKGSCHGNHFGVFIGLDSRHHIGEIYELEVVEFSLEQNCIVSGKKSGLKSLEKESDWPWGDRHRNASSNWTVLHNFHSQKMLHALQYRHRRRWRRYSCEKDVWQEVNLRKHMESFVLFVETIVKQRLFIQRVVGGFDNGIGSVLLTVDLTVGNNDQNVVLREGKKPFIHLKRSDGGGTTFWDAFTNLMASRITGPKFVGPGSDVIDTGKKAQRSRKRESPLIWMLGAILL